MGCLEKESKLERCGGQGSLEKHRYGKTERERDKKEACIVASIIWWLLFSDKAEINSGK